MHWQDIQGWFTEEDAAALSSLLRSVPHGSLTAHVGIYAGRHLCACADAIRGHCRVLAVDTYKGSISADGQSSEATPEAFLIALLDFHRHLWAFGLQDSVCLFPGTSLQAAREVLPDERFSLVFLDADHGYEPVKADILAWRPRIAPGGILCGHDRGVWKGVDRAVEELLPAAEMAGSVWWVRV